MVTVEGGLVVDPSRLAVHLPGTTHFENPVLPPPRTALYSCILNTPELTALFKTAKDDTHPELAKDAWVQVAEYRDELTSMKGAKPRQGWYTLTGGAIPRQRV